MITLIEGNVLLKPSHRKQLMAWLKRSLRLGERMGDFALTITLRRAGRHIEAHATVHDSVGDFDLRKKKEDWHTALRDLVRELSDRLHSQYVHRATFAPI